MAEPDVKKKPKKKGQIKKKLSKLQKEVKQKWDELDNESHERTEEYQKDFLNLFYTNINEETREDVPDPENIEQIRVFFGYDSIIDELSKSSQQITKKTYNSNI